ncbi:MAG: DNA alkylation repair protein [Cyclobacteriaceae bacterium]
MINPFHQEILTLIKKNSGKPKADPFLNSYLGNEHVRYPINNPTLREIAKDWMRTHKDLKVDEFKKVLTSLIEGESCTEKMMAGILMGYSFKNQRTFDPMAFDQWLDHLVGWVEVDTLCTGDFITTQLPAEWPKWKKLIIKLSKDENMNKRRASLVLFCSPLGRVKDDDIAEVAFKTVERLKAEKDVLITKAISWVLRTMIKHYRESVASYLEENEGTLPKIAVRETMVKLKTGKKTK